MTQATRIDNDEAINLVRYDSLTAQHRLTIFTESGPIQHHATQKAGTLPFRFYVGQSWLGYAQLSGVLEVGGFVELIETTPSPFDDEAFRGWFSGVTGGKEEYKGLKSATITQSGTITVDTFAVPIDRIPEAARHINALLALGDGK